MKRSIAEHNAMASVLDDRERGPIFPDLPDSPDISGLGPRDKVILTCGSDLTPQPVRWLWQYWLALGKLHILAGAPGQGKTTIALAMAATVTIGGRWPDGSRCAPGNVLIWSGEDDPADTLVPRLKAAGADCDRCHFITGTRRDGDLVPFDPARDLGQLLEAIDTIGGISLLVIDPVVSAVTGDSHKNTEVRRALQPLVDLAAKCDCAVLGITHFAKGGQGTDPAQRVVGSVAFTAVARVVMVAAKVKGDEEGQDARILARSKSNIGPDDGGFQYHLEQSEPIPGIHASHIAWGKAVQGTARELLTDPEEAARFVRATGVDALAIAIGTSHGAYKFTRPPTGEILAIDRIQAIHAAVPNAHLVMHGSSSVPQEWLAIIRQYGGDIKETYGVPVEEIVRGIRSGVRKVNIDTDIRLAMTGAMRKTMTDKPSEFDPRRFLEAARRAANDICRARFEAFGCAGQASRIKPRALESFAIH